MIGPRSILIVDDEVSFLRSTGELLRRDGYDCDAVPDTRQAVERLRAKRYDLLIVEIEMPGNRDLEFVEQASQLARGMPIILVTRHPSLGSAIRSTQLPVVAYLKKPVRDAELRTQVENSLQHSRISDVQEHLRQCVEELEAVKFPRWSGAAPRENGALMVPVVTLRRLAACVCELLNMETRVDPLKDSPLLCALLDCPQWRVHRDAMQKTVKLLEKTKRQLSKDLGQARAMLEDLLTDSEESSHGP